MIQSDHLRKDIIVPVLHHIGSHSKNACELLLLTAAQESHCGEYLHQINGPARGIYQMEPATHKDCWENYLTFKKDLAAKIFGFAYPNLTEDLIQEIEEHIGWPDPEIMIYNLRYATAMARCSYLRHSESLPEHDDVEGMAMYYKKYYNTSLGAATIQEAIDNYKRYVLI